MDKFPSAEEHQAEHSHLQKTTEQTTAVVQQQQLSMGRKMMMRLNIDLRTELLILTLWFILGHLLLLSNIPEPEVLI